METIFSKMLVQRRKDAGFPTAYRFYHDSGGNGVLKISYRKYLLIEQGLSLPVFNRLNIFIWALRLIPKSAVSNEFVAAWLRTMAGEEDYKELIEPLLGARPDLQGVSPMQKAVNKAVGSKTYCLTLEQTKVIYASRDNYLCYLAITNDTGAWTPKALADRLMLTVPAVVKALKAFAGVKLVKEVKKGAYKCPIVGMMKVYPGMDKIPAELRVRIQAYDNELAAKGETAFMCRSMLRADERDFRNFFSIIESDINTSSTYAVHEKTGKSALFSVEGRVTRLREF